MGTVVYGLLGRLVNRPGSTLQLAFTPDQVHDSGGLPDYGRLYRYWSSQSQVTNAGDPFRLMFLMQNVEMIMREGIPGDFVELGVYKGNSAKILKHYTSQHGRRLFLFDTYEGFDRKDLVGIDSDQPEEAFTGTSLERIKAFVGAEDTEFVKGYFPDSVGDRTFQVAFLHIDCDLYEPALAALNVFYGQMSPGGMIVVHDYSSGHWPGIAKAVDGFFADKPEKPVLLSDKSGTAIVRIASRVL